MNYKTDLQIAKEADIKPITEIAEFAGIGSEYLIPFGGCKAKVSQTIMDQLTAKDDGKLILVTAINPTPAGEGKTTISIGLADGLKRIGKKTMLALREPSLGPVFGIKGGAAGGGYAQVIPMEDINLHFTGDLHAISAANNLLCALVDNHLQQGNCLNIDSRRITIKRCIDMNDRQLRYITSGLGGTSNGIPRETGFDITAACEVMAVFCLSKDICDLKRRLNNIVVAYTMCGDPVTAADLNAGGAMAVLLKDAINPNLVQTLEHTPVLMHGGPFANIAHGCNSYIATKTALKLADYVVTEAGFGADLGAEKFLDIKCRKTGIWPNAVCVVVTVRALKSHGGVCKEELTRPDAAAVKRGIPNLIKHINNLTNIYKLPVTVAINHFAADTDEETQTIIDTCTRFGTKAIVTDVWAQGGVGAVELAQEIVLSAEKGHHEPRYPYALEDSISEKIEAIVKHVYGGTSIKIAPKAKEQIKRLTEHGYAGLPVCIAKTQYSFSDDPRLIGCPMGFEFSVREVHLSAGAGFIVILSGNIMTMPGLPKVPAAEGMTISDDGEIDGLF